MKILKLPMQKILQNKSLKMPFNTSGDVEIDGVVYHNFKLLSMSGRVHKGEHIVTLVIA